MKTQILSFIVILSSAFFSCQKLDDNKVLNSEESVLKSAEIAENEIMVSSVVEEANYEAEFFADSEKLLRKLSRFGNIKNYLVGKQNMRYLAKHAPEVNIDSSDTGYPVVITLDYGDGTELNNGRILSGIIIIEISAPKGTDGATRIITYDDCVIDSVGINGVCNQVFNGDNETTRVITNSSEVTFTMADGLVIDRTGSHVREWISGIDTPMEHDDDQISITGSTDLSTSLGDTWSRLIVEPLIKLGDCRHYVQGVIQISQNGEIVSLLDFGDGECDYIAELTTDGETIEIELKDRKPKANMSKNKKENGNKKGR